MNHLSIPQLQRLEHDLLQEIDDLEYFKRPTAAVQAQLAAVRKELQTRSLKPLHAEEDADIQLLGSAAQLIESDIATINNLLEDARWSGDSAKIFEYRTLKDDLRASSDQILGLGDSLKKVRAKLSDARKLVSELNQQIETCFNKIEELRDKSFLDRAVIVQIKDLRDKIEAIRNNPIFTLIRLAEEEERSILQHIRHTLKIRAVTNRDEPPTLRDRGASVGLHSDYTSVSPQTQTDELDEIAELRKELQQAISDGEPKNVIRALEKRLRELEAE